MAEPALVGDHWARTAPLWQPGRSVLTWHVVFPTASGLHELAQQLAPLLCTPWLEPVPPQWLHLTTRGVGPRSRVGDDALEQLVTDATEALAGEAPLHLTLGPAQVAGEGVALAAGLTKPLARLQRLLPGTEEPAAFWPHVSLAYACNDGNATELRRQLAARPTSVEVEVDSVALLDLRRGRRLYHWDVVAEVPLGRTEPDEPDEPAGDGA